MKKMLLSAFLATAGCMNVGPAPDQIGTSRSAATVVDHDDDGDAARKLPKLRYYPPSQIGGGTGSGGTGGGSGGPAWRPTSAVGRDNLYGGIALLLTDGGVMVHSIGTSDWYKLTPDLSGSYENGTWKQLASMPNGYAPSYFASAVLPDGRVIIEGGEYDNWEPVWGTRGAIYDPVADRWTEVAPPAGWFTIGDAQSTVLADGRFLLADCCSTRTALLDPKTLTWTEWGSGKADLFDEEAWTLLPNGKLLTVDANNPADLTASEIFSPSTGKWTSAGSTIVKLPDTNGDNSGSHELGPALLRPDGSVFAMGGSAHTAIYKAGKWTAGPDFPIVDGEGQLDVADGPAALQTNGHVLFVASPGIFNAPAHVLEYDGKNIKEIARPGNAKDDTSYQVNLLLLPSGEILFTDFSNDIEIYKPEGKAQCGWEPSIDNGCSLSTLKTGQSYRLDGTTLNGLSQAVAYGDDAQASTNYPIVRITNRQSGHVQYVRTHDHSYMGVSSGKRSHTTFDVPATLEAGRSTLEVVANGIASQPIDVRIVASPIQ